MANNKTMKFHYTGIQFAEDVQDMQVIVNIDYDTYYELKYLLSFAAEQHEYYSHIKDAVHLRDSLIECWQTAVDENEQENNK